jgi:hypothetical protein
LYLKQNQCSENQLFCPKLKGAIDFLQIRQLADNGANEENQNQIRYKNGYAD